MFAAAPGFFAIINLRDMLLSNAPLLLVATGMTFVIIVAQIDISVGSLFGVTALACGALAQEGCPMALLPLATLLMGGALGAVNAGLVAFVGVPSIVVTLATMVIWREALRWVSGGAWIEGLPANFQWLGLGQSTGRLFIIGLSLAIFLFMAWGSRHLWLARSVFATGSDTEAARVAGVPVKKVVFWAFILMGALTGLASFLNAVRFSDVPANSGINLELKAIAAVVVGGTPITGGKGSLWGTFLGVALLACLGPALVYLGISPFWEKAIQGAIILFTVPLEAFLSQRRQKEATV
jgi:ribose/xylose/arabinose/galactoside ABC-type transport system permease subunit